MGGRLGISRIVKLLVEQIDTINRSISDRNESIMQKTFTSIKLSLAKPVI